MTFTEIIIPLLLGSATLAIVAVEFRVLREIIKHKDYTFAFIMFALFNLSYLTLYLLKITLSTFLI
jgi:hypothetical protein